LYIICVGQANGGYNGDGLPATSSIKNDPKAAYLTDPQSVAVDVNDNLYIADFWSYRIRKVDAITRLISTIAGINNPFAI
jgi:adhesin/invasin